MKAVIKLRTTDYGMKSCGLDGRTFQPTIKVNYNYKPTDCDTPAVILWKIEKNFIELPSEG